MRKICLFLCLLSGLLPKSCQQEVTSGSTYVYFSENTLTIEEVISYFAENEIELEIVIKSNEDNKFLITYNMEDKEKIYDLSVDFNFTNLEKTFTFTDEEGNILFEDSSIFSFYFYDGNIEITVSDTDTFFEVTNNLVGQKMMLWIGYVEESESYIGDFKAYSGLGSEQEKIEAEKKIIANAIVNEGINTSPVRITGTYKYDDETLNKLFSNEICYYAVK